MDRYIHGHALIAQLAGGTWFRPTVVRVRIPLGAPFKSQTAIYFYDARIVLFEDYRYFNVTCIYAYRLMD